MAIDDVLDEDWEWNEEEDEDLPQSAAAEEGGAGFDPDVETVRIKRYAFAWQAELAKSTLTRQQIPCFITNQLTNLTFGLDWAKVELYVRKVDAAQAIEILGDIDIPEN